MGCGKASGATSDPPALLPIQLSLFIFNLFYGSRVDLQCCVTFCCRANWFSYAYIHSFSYSFPLWFISGHWIEFPVLPSRTLLCIHPIHNSLLIPNSQSIPPHLLPSWQPQVCQPSQIFIACCCWVSTSQGSGEKKEHLAPLLRVSHCWENYSLSQPPTMLTTRQGSRAQHTCSGSITISLLSARPLNLLSV